MPIPAETAPFDTDCIERPLHRFRRSCHEDVPRSPQQPERIDENRVGLQQADTSRDNHHRQEAGGCHQRRFADEKRFTHGPGEERIFVGNLLPGDHLAGGKLSSVELHFLAQVQPRRQFSHRLLSSEHLGRRTPRCFRWNQHRGQGPAPLRCSGGTNQVKERSQPEKV